MKLTVIILLIFCSLICYSACAVSENKTERIKDDEAQWEWIKKYNKANKVGRQALKVDKKM